MGISGGEGWVQGLRNCESEEAKIVGPEVGHTDIVRRRIVILCKGDYGNFDANHGY